MGEGTECSTFCALHVALGAPSMLRIGYQNKQGYWQTLYDYDGFYGGFHYGAVCFGGWNYGCVVAPQKRRALMLRHKRGLRLRFENDVTDSALRLKRFALELK